MLRRGGSRYGHERTSGRILKEKVPYPNHTMSIFWLRHCAIISQGVTIRENQGRAHSSSLLLLIMPHESTVISKERF
jgi:hypothetical protein